MPTFEFEVGNQIYEVDAPDAAAAAAKFRGLRAPKTGYTGSWNGRPDKFDPDPNWRPGPLGDLSKQASLTGAFTAQPNVPSGGSTASPQTTGAGTPLPPPLPATPNASTGSVDAFKQTLSEESVPRRMLIGAGSAIEGMRLSLGQLLGYEPSEEELKAYQAVINDPAGLAGNVVGNIASLAIPGSAAERTLAGVSRAGKEVAKLAPVLRRTLAGMGVAGAEGALLTPIVEEEDSRATNALKNAAGAGAIAAGGRLLTGLVRPSEAGKRVVEQGVQPTISQGGGGILGKALGYAEDLAGSIPGFEQVVRRGQLNAEKEALDVAARRASPRRQRNGASMGEVGPGEFFKKSRVNFDDSYKQLLRGKLIPVDPVWRSGVRQEVDNALAHASEEARNIVERDMLQFVPDFTGKVKGEAWKTLRDNVRRLKESHAVKAEQGVLDDRAMFNAYKAIEDKLIEARNVTLSPDEIRRFNAVDEAWDHHKILLSASKGGNLNIKSLDRAARKAATPETAAAHTGRYQDLTVPGSEVFQGLHTKDSLGRRIGNYVAATALGGAYTLSGTPAVLPLYLAAGLAGSTRSGSKAMMGNTRVQQVLADLLRGRAGTIAAGASGTWE